MTLNMSIAHASVNTWKFRVGLNLSPRQDRKVPGTSTSRVRARRWSALALAGSGKPRRNGETSSLQGVSVKEAHLLRNIGDSQEIEQRQQKTVEDGKHAGSIPLAHLTVI